MCECEGCFLLSGLWAFLRLESIGEFGNARNFKSCWGCYKDIVMRAFKRTYVLMYMKLS